MKWGLALRGRKIIISTVFASPAPDGMEGLPAGRYTKPLALEPRLPSQHRAAQQFSHTRQGGGACRERRHAGFFRPTGSSLSLSLVFMDGGEEERERRRSGFFLFLFPQDSGQGSNCGSTQGQQQQRP